MSNIVISYFEPFGERKINTSMEVVRELKVSANRVCLPVSWNDISNELDKIFASEPRYLFLLGEAGDYSNVKIERFAHNNSFGTDNKGIKKNNELIIKDGLKELETNVKLEYLKDYEISNDAGSYLCNYAYYLALHKNEVTKVVFIHVPYFHSKGIRSKPRVIEDVSNIIDIVLKNDNSYLAKLNNKVVEVTEANAYRLFPYLQKEYHFPNILFGLEYHDDGSFTMTSRIDGLDSGWEENGKNKDELETVRNSLIFKAANFLDIVYHDGNSGDYEEKTHRFSPIEYYTMQGSEKKFMTLFICHADYKDELSFYKSLDKVEEDLIEVSPNEEEKKALEKAKDFISRMGMEKCKQILFKIAK